MNEDIGRPLLGDDQGEADALLLSQKNVYLAKLNADPYAVEEDEVWRDWLWECDPLQVSPHTHRKNKPKTKTEMKAKQECHMDILLNRMHLLGLLIARNYKTIYHTK